MKRTLQGLCKKLGVQVGRVSTSWKLWSIKSALHTYVCAIQKWRRGRWGSDSQIIYNGVFMFNQTVQAICEQHPEIDTRHILSDGPTCTAQDRNRFNLWLMLQCLCARWCLLPKWASWNLISEGSHGGDPMDEVGYVLKRRADRQAAYTGCSDVGSSLNS